MRRYATGVLVVLAVLVAASCDLVRVPAPELQVITRAKPGDEPADLASGLTMEFGKPGNGVNEDVVVTIRNIGDADLILEAAAPHYVAIVDQNEAEKPFSIAIGADTNSIGPGEEVSVTVRFVGQSTSTRYAAKLLIPSNDGEHPDYFLNLQGDGDGF